MQRLKYYKQREYEEKARKVGITYSANAIKVILFFVIAGLVLSGCLNPQKPEVAEIKLELLSISKNGSGYDATILVKSISGDRFIPTDALFVNTGERVFMLSDSSNVTVIREGNNTNAIEPNDIYMIHLKPSDKYLDIYPQSHDLRILTRLFVKPNANTFANATKYIVNDEREGFIVPHHKAAYYDGKIILLDDCIVGEKGRIIQPLAEEKVNLNLTLREGFTLKRIIYSVAGADSLGIVMAIHNGYGFSIEPMNDAQGAFLFAPIENEKVALDYLRFLMHDVQYSAMGRKYEEITSDGMFEDSINEIKKHCKDKGEQMRIVKMPSTNFTTVKADGEKYIVERVYFTRFPEKIEYIKAIVYKNGYIDIIENYDCVIGVYYYML